MQITAVAASCGQMAAALGLLCIANILAQWAVSTPRHSIHRGWQAALQAELQAELQAWWRSPARGPGFFLPFEPQFLHYFEALPLYSNPCAKIPSRGLFMA